MRVAILLGLLLVAGPILGADYVWTDSSYIATPVLTATSSSGATGGVVTVSAWTDAAAANVFVQVDTTKDGDVYLAWNVDAIYPTGAATGDVTRVGIDTVNSNGPLVYDGTFESTTTPVKDTKWTREKTGSDGTADWTLASTNPNSWKYKGTGNGYTIVIKRAKTATDTGDYATFVTGGGNNKLWIRQTVGVNGGVVAANAAAVDLPTLASDPVSTAVQQLTLKPLRTTAFTFIDPATTGLTLGRKSAALTGNTPFTVQAALYKVGTDAKLAVTATKDGYVLFCFGGTDAKICSEADVLKISFQGGVVTLSEATTIAATGTNILGTGTFTSPATAWKLAQVADDTKLGSWSYSSTTGYKVELLRPLVKNAVATPGQNVAITDTTQVGIWVSNADIAISSAKDAPAGTDSANNVLVKQAFSVGATDAKDPTPPSNNPSTNTATGGKNSAIVAFSLMVLATLGLFAY